MSEFAPRAGRAQGRIYHGEASGSPRTSGAPSPTVIVRRVADEASVLLGAGCCSVTLSLDRNPRAMEAVSPPDPNAPWANFIAWLDLCGIYDVIRRHGGAIRMTGEQVARLPGFRIATLERPVRGWLAASLAMPEDGRECGAIQLFDGPNGSFTARDEAAVVHLAALTSAALQARLHCGAQR